MILLDAHNYPIIYNFLSFHVHMYKYECLYLHFSLFQFTLTLKQRSFVKRILHLPAVVDTVSYSFVDDDGCGRVIIILIAGVGLFGD